MRLEGWRVTWALTSMIVIGVLTILALGVNEEALRLVLRVLARASLVLFFFAFSASSLVQLFDSTGTRWLRRNRRYIGVSFAMCHFIHLGAIVALTNLFPRPFFGKLAPLGMFFSVITYLWIAAMAATSSDRAVALLGRRSWEVLHLIGAYIIWAMFAYSYLEWAFYNIYYTIGSLLVVSSLGLRLIARLMQVNRGSPAT